MIVPVSCVEKLQRNPATAVTQLFSALPAPPRFLRNRFEVVPQWRPVRVARRRKKPRSLPLKARETATLTFPHQNGWRGRPREGVFRAEQSDAMPPYSPSLSSSNGNSSSWSSLGLEGEACEERLSFSPSDRFVSKRFVVECIPVGAQGSLGMRQTISHLLTHQLVFY